MLVLLYNEIAAARCTTPESRAGFSQPTGSNLTLTQRLLGLSCIDAGHGWCNWCNGSNCVPTTLLHCILHIICPYAIGTMAQTVFNFSAELHFHTLWLPWGIWCNGSLAVCCIVDLHVKDCKMWSLQRLEIDCKSAGVKSMNPAVAAHFCNAMCVAVTQYNSIQHLKNSASQW